MSIKPTLKPALFFLCLFIIYSVSAQDVNKLGVVNLTKISFISPGISYEQKIGRFQTVYGRAFLDPSGYWGYSSSMGTSSHLYLDPAITIQYRYYYNALRRGAKGKNIEMNNLNYVAPVFKTTFNAENSQRSVHRTGIVWGFQRNYRRRFSLDLNLGVGYGFASEGGTDNGEIIAEQVSGFTTIGQLNIGIWLNRRTS
jgi:hypothetical protein